MIEKKSICTPRNEVKMRTCKEECLYYLKYSRTEKEVRSHLYNKDYKDNEIEESIEYAKELNYIDDYDYAYSYINDHLLINKWGPLKIKINLRDKGISDETIENGLLDCEELIYRNLEDQANKKINVNRELDYNEKNKIIRHLLNKGYEYQMIKEVLDKYE